MKILPLLLILPSSTLLAQTAAPSPAEHIEGYKDTPILPGTPWHVHDPDRPQPPVVTPGDAVMPGKPPSDAVVLFDGGDLAHWRSDKGGEPKWKIENRELVDVPSEGYLYTREQFGDVQLHIEFAEPLPSQLGGGAGQGKGNSGVFMMGAFEIQVLDCYHNKTYPDGQTAALYGQHPPLVNACRPPGEWQSYDIVFEAPRFDGATLKSPAYATVFHNGVLVQDHQAFLGPTGYRILAHYKPMAAQGPIGLQAHGAAVRFRNIWIRPLDLPSAQ